MYPDFYVPVYSQDDSHLGKSLISTESVCIFECNCYICFKQSVLIINGKPITVDQTGAILGHKILLIGFNVR